MKISRVAATLAALAALGVACGAADAADSASAASSPAHGPASAARTLEALVPAWFTEEVYLRARQAAEVGNAIPLPDDANVPTSSLLFPGIRPGTRMIAPSGCTLNYVFGTGTSLSIGTAGHCARVGEDVTVVAAPGVLVNIGTVTRSVANGIGDDFALIRIRPAMRRYVNASISYLGGPTGRATPKAGDAVAHTGHGLLVGYGGTPRAGVVTYRTGTGFGWLGIASAGDSGAPVRLLDGRAAGGLTHVIADPAALPTTVAGTTISRMEQIAGLPVARANALPDPTLPIPVGH